MLTALFALLLLVVEATAKVYYAGVSESGGEFGVYSSTGIVGTGLPGRFGVDYAFINESTVDIFVDQDKVSRCPRLHRIRLMKVTRSTYFELRSYSSECAL